MDDHKTCIRLLENVLAAVFVSLHESVDEAGRSKFTAYLGRNMAEILALEDEDSEEALVKTLRELFPDG